MSSRYFLSVALALVGLLIAFAGVVVLGCQGLSWLRHGVWPPISLWDAWHWLGVPDLSPDDWLDVQRIFDPSLGFALFSVGSLIYFWGIITLAPPNNKRIADTGSVE
jgi:hypothetical protein